MKNNQNTWGDMRDLRLAAESLADAIDLRVKTQNRIRSGTADLLTEGGTQPTEAEIRRHPLVQVVTSLEEQYRTLLRERYEQVVPVKIREWALGQPILKSGELFPRIVGLTGNPRWAVPLKMEGTGKDRRAVPDGEPYARYCTCLCSGCVKGRRLELVDLSAWGDESPHCWISEDGCRGLRHFYQWCGIGDPDRVPRTAAELKAMGIPVMRSWVELGDHVDEGDPLVTLKNGKRTLDIPSPVTGAVTELHVRAGTKVHDKDKVALLESVQGEGVRVTEVVVPELGDFGVISPQEYLLSMGKRTTIRPLLRAFSNQLVISGGRSEMVRESKYYKLYHKVREDVQGRRHTKECQNHKRPPLSPNGCGTVAHREWGEIGSEWRPGHVNAHAHRIVQKALLRDFWRQAEGTE